ncbi:hypothetical protein BGZ54_002621, partial [Gamsiella multidivaricata]
MLISCRSEFIGQDDRDRFQPTDRNHSAASSLFQEAVIVPFSSFQVEDYIRPLWRTKQYLEALEQVPNLQDLVRNPFLLTLSLEVLPRVVDAGQMQDLSRTRVTRVALYDQFVEQWLERGKKCVGGNELSPQAKAAFDTLVDDGFTLNGTDFLKRLAAAIYREQAGQPVVEYSRSKDEETWKTKFFSREDEVQLLREACPLSRSGRQYRFIHRSLLEYCFALAVFDPQENKAPRPTSAQARRGSVSSMFSFEWRAASEEKSTTTQQPAVNHPLTWRSFVGEPSVLQFLAERAQQEPIFKQQLLAMIERSKTDEERRNAAANAITILVRAGIRFNGADLKGIRIPGADLSGGEFDSAQLQEADLRKVNLRDIWLRQADLNNARMAGVQFGEWPYFMEDGGVSSCAFSPDGRACAVGVADSTISVYDTTTWSKTLTLGGHTDYVTSVVYSPSGKQIASGSDDKTVRLWDVHTDRPGVILSGHDDVVMAVAFSPCGHQIASGSEDKTVRLWNAQTRAPVTTLSGHAGVVRSVAYSPSGQQIASGSEDMTVQLWDVKTGSPVAILSDHTARVMSVVYSPSGHQIASGSEDMTVLLWDVQAGTSVATLRGHAACVEAVVGHTNRVTSLVYSPTGQQIASGSVDKTVRLWDVQTSAIDTIKDGHTACVESVVYSPSGKQIASCSYDKTVRLWDAQTGALDAILSGHTDLVTRIMYSPSGQQVALGSGDNTVRLWGAQTGALDAILSGHSDA